MAKTILTAIVELTILDLILVFSLSWTLENSFEGGDGGEIMFLLFSGVVLASNVVYGSLRLLYSVVKKKILQSDKLGRVFLPIVLIVSILIPSSIVIAWGEVWNLNEKVWGVFLLVVPFFIVRTIIASQLTKTRKV
jgi:hypothetical protein